MSNAPVTIPSAGGSTTTTFNDWPAADGLGQPIQLHLWHGDVLNGLAVQYESKELSHHGSTDAPSATIFLENIHFPDGDPPVKVSGTYGNYYGATHFWGVTITTNSGRVFGPYGTGNNSSGGSSFSIQAPGGSYIAAFSGGCYLHSDGTNYLSLLGGTALPLG